MSVLAQVFSSKVLRGHYADETPLIAFEYKGSPQEQKRLISMVNKIASFSETGKAVLQKAADSGYSLSFAMQSGSYGYADAESKSLVLNPRFKDADLLNTLVHESRHAGQFESGIEVRFGQLTLRSEIMSFRAMEADACATATFSLLEAEKNGLKIKGGVRTGASAETKKLFNENADAKTVLQTAFDSWYADRMTKESYEDGYIIQQMRDTLKKNKEADTPYDKPVASAQVIEQICTTPNGCYFDDKNALDDVRYLDISVGTKTVADRFFQIREMRTGMKPDDSYADLPVNRGFTFLHGNFHGVCYDKSQKKLPLILAQKQRQSR